MRKIAFLLLIPFAFACSDIKENPEYLKLQAERDSLSGITNMDATKINEYLSDFNEIQDNLNRIKEAENLITVKTTGDVELNQTQKDDINNDVQLIYDLMQKNKETIAMLKKKLKKSDGRIAELEKMIENLSTQMELKDQEIESLKIELEKLNIKIEILHNTVDSLNVEGTNKDQNIAEKTEALNTAYYVFGTKKELTEHQVITKEGGFIGIGRIEKLMEDFNKDYFTKIDITQTKVINLNANKARIITTHPSGSYKMISNGDVVDRIEILNPKEFWGTSKYLVIVVD